MLIFNKLQPWTIKENFIQRFLCLRLSKALKNGSTNFVVYVCVNSKVNRSLSLGESVRPVHKGSLFEESSMRERLAISKGMFENMLHANI